jgi:hypothetical protein
MYLAYETYQESFNRITTKYDPQELLEKLSEYQKKHKIKDQCLTNVSFWYKAQITYGSDFFKPKPVIVIYTFEQDGELCVASNVHMVLYSEQNKKILDVSADMASLKKAEYIPNIKLYRQFLKNTGHTDKKGEKWTIGLFLQFQKFAKEIEKDNLMVCDTIYFEKLFSL